MATFTVTNTNDSGAGSLRQAVADANLTGENDTIQFAANTSGTVVLTSGQLAITGTITIDGDTNGDNKADYTVSGNDASRIFSVSSSNLFLESVNLVDGFSGGQGGAIYVSNGNLHLTDSTISSSVSTLNGGAVYIKNSFLQVSSSLFIDNHSGLNGGALSTVDTFSEVFNSTFFDNSAAGSGGAIIVSGGQDTLFLANSTVTQNNADSDGAAQDQGGGLKVGISTNVVIQSSVIADNTSGNAQVENDIVGNPVAAYSSVIGTGGTFTLQFNSSTEIGVANVGLYALADNGGTTLTQQIRHDSVLLDNGYNFHALATDANGGPRTSGIATDVGASEFIVNAPLVVTNLNDSGAGSLRQAIFDAGSAGHPGFDTIIFQAGLSGQIVLTSGALEVLAGNNLSINGDNTGDGDAEISIKGTTFSPALTVAIGANLALDSLNFNEGSGGYLRRAAAIENSGALTIANSVFSNNTMAGSTTYAASQNGTNVGGAIFNEGNLTIVETVFSGNSATGGDGINNFNNSVFNTQADPGGEGGDAAGAIFNTGTLLIGDVAFIANNAQGGGGGDGGNAYGPLGMAGNGGSGGNVTGGIISTYFGTANGTFSLSSGTLVAGIGGAPGNDNTGPASAGPNGTVYATNWIANGLGTLNTVALGTQNVDTVSVSGRFNGLMGADNITGAYNSYIYGGSGNDTLTSFGVSHAFGGLGNDTIRSTYLGAYIGGGTWDGGEGIDTFDASLATNVAGIGLGMNLSTSTNTFGGLTVNFENIIGTNIVATSDSLTGSDAANSISGMAGADYIEGLAGGDTLDGGTEVDMLVYGQSDTGVTINLALNTASGGHATDDHISNFENVQGSNFGDTITGNNAANILLGGDGIDTLNGGLGDDTLIGALDGDVLNGGSGLHDVADYSVSNFAVTVGINAGGTVTGGHATGDVLTNIEDLVGSGFGDTLVGNSTQNILHGLGGADNINASNNNDILFGEDGDDLLVGGAGADVLNGGNNDAGGDTASYANSTGSGVTVNLALGTATGSGHGTGDTLSNIENIIGSAFDDTLTGDGNNNVLTGGNGGDTFTGGGGADTLIGQGGDDTFIGGAGADSHSGGSGTHDKISYAASAFGVTVNLGPLGVGAGGDAAGDTWTGIEDVTGSASGDTLTGSTAANILLGGLGNDTLSGGAGADTLNGGSGTQDTANYATSNAGVTIDLLLGTASGGHATGDTLVGIENIFGSTHDDVLTGNNLVNFLTGFGGNDTLTALNNADILFGGTGNDTMNGGSGNDTFFYAELNFGQDTINGWVNGQDKLDMLANTGLSYADFTKTQSGADTLLTYTADPAQTIRLVGVLATTIDAGDFV
jgi:Ca2+-binding RTX toxin-like protein